MDAELLLRELRESTRSIVRREPRVAVAYSGGLDSSVVARLAGEIAEIRLYTCAVEGSHDAEEATRMAAEEGLRTELIILDEGGLLTAVQETARILGTTDPHKIAYTVPVSTVLTSSKEPVVLVGSGADELFGGYAKYAAAPDPEAQMRIDLKKMLAELGLLARAAEGLGKRLGAPFADRRVIELAQSTPLDRKVLHGTRKKVLREVAELLELSSYDRPKKAAQYSSGVMRQMRRLAKTRGMSLAEWTRSVCARAAVGGPSQSN